LQLADGTLVQVGKSTEARQDLLARFRATLGLITLSIVVVALTGGWLATRSAVQPIRRLGEVVRRISKPSVVRGFRRLQPRPAWQA
jgi:nitrogen fixation/metabolism regulation signal transduction histidine kinase